MATVYLARESSSDRLVAIKLYDPETAGALGLARFQREIQLTTRLDHPNILPVLDSGSFQNRLWYAMPYAEDGSLRARLQQKGQLGMPEAVRLAREVAAALDHAH